MRLVSMLDVVCLTTTIYGGLIIGLWFHMKQHLGVSLPGILFHMCKGQVPCAGASPFFKWVRNM